MDLFKVNIDGAIERHNSYDACGGLARGSTKRWLGEFIQFVGHCNSLEADLCVVVQGILLVRRLNLKNVIIESDSLETVASVSTSNDLWGGSPLVWKIRKLVKDRMDISVKHIRRKANQPPVDWLAKKRFQYP
ncbi:uncharacterized protein LOC133305426 [Gastrolobium bilobum]|uniref:uncharacterized protein LOC133305426 n=1 Tax=Gastrolobium bilobum TaxID=150636 RepID=UPI002AAFD2CC|nr:uncharacterized protein LOC133305426 [Gastrolobium bilobum]